MAIKDWFKTDVERLARPVPQRAIQMPPADEAFIGHGRDGIARINDRLPRGTDVIREQIDRKERARWARAHEIAAFGYQSGHVLLGKYGGRLIGYGGDKPMVMVAAARSGKTATVLVPALYTYPGSAMVLDPKGELAAATASYRRDVLGQDVAVLDPFGVSGQVPSPFNPLAELDLASPTLVDDVDTMTQALVLSDSGEEGNHWTNASQALLRGLILHTLTKPPAERTLVTVRELMMLTYPPLVALQAALAAKGSKDPTDAAQTALFMEMAQQTGLFGGALAGAGTSFLRKAPRERASIVSTLETQGRWLDSEPMQASLRGSGVTLSALADRPMTIYLCLPSSMMESHYRWLRLVISLTLRALERRGTWPRGKTPILLMLEEFAILGHMPILEKAAAFLPGFGVKLMCILQDLNQLQRHYAKGWGTFLGNAGVQQFFGNSDSETLDYVSNRLGSLSFVRGDFGGTSDKKDGSKDFVDKERLAYGWEVAEAFSRDTGAQLLMFDGKPPMAIERLTFEDVQMIKSRQRPVPS